MKIIDEVKQLTANEVAKKQNAAKLNFPNVISKIKSQASLGCSKCILMVNEINEYDKKLLEQEGFRVCLIDKPYSQLEKHDYTDFIKQRDPLKYWEVSW